MYFIVQVCSQPMKLLLLKLHIFKSVCVSQHSFGARVICLTEKIPLSVVHVS